MLSKTLSRIKNRSSFVDSVKVLLSSGSGGDGASIMAHLHGNEFAGPGGGNGGNGGNVMLRCNRHVPDLGHIQSLGNQLSAESGCGGYAREARGRKGKDLWLDLPVGTNIIDVDTNDVMFDLDEDGVEVSLLEGGQGGKGNAAFANKWHHTPIESTRGLPGNTMLAQFELKTLADCALIGYPNAGKSSLLSAISLSKPSIAPYAFTTLRPYVGLIYDLYGNICRVADVPGLIEGAYENRGLGHQFLRHVERTKTLAFVVDMSDVYNPNVGEEASLKPWDVIELLQLELDYYLPGLSSRAIMVFANKMDIAKDSTGMCTQKKLSELKRRIKLPVFPVSAMLGLKLGMQDPQCGLEHAVQYMCSEVFDRKATEREILQRRQRNERLQLDKVFKTMNNGFYSNVEENPESCPNDYSCTSLVDQQLEFFGNGGLGETSDGYQHSVSKGKLQSYRDLTMKGKYWSLTRNEGESITGEKWK
ncbi:unnamed protein product [Phytomonas sp. Hart1]|nr:unnamed protein product [Phytomonas sp. Hart1]|eukprot:CCW66877.1 unnamed protein product [Phytomonas sp. isolate Hart1]